MYTGPPYIYLVALLSGNKALLNIRTMFNLSAFASCDEYDSSLENDGY